VAAGQPYEAHQKARTFAARYVKSGQHATAIDVLFQSARELFKIGQQGSGTDLTVFLLDTYETGQVGVDDESRGRLTQLIALTGSSGSWRKQVIDRSIAWSARVGACPAGDQDLQHYVGEVLYKDGVFDDAEPHLLASGKRDSARLLAEMFVQWSADSDASIAGLFALRGTIPYLQNGNILAARTFITTFVSAVLAARPRLVSQLQSESLSVPADDDASEVRFCADPLLNFCQLAVLACQRADGERSRAARENWVKLCGTYQSRGGALASGDVRVALNEIAQLYFGIAAPRSQSDNPLGAMLSSMLGGGPPGGGAPQRRMLAPVRGRLDAPGLD